MARLLYPWLFARDVVPKSLTPQDSETYYGGTSLTIPTRRSLAGFRHQARYQGLYNWLMVQVLQEIGYGRRIAPYTEYVPDVEQNPYLRGKIGDAMWFLWLACNRTMLPLMNFMVVRKGDKDAVPRGAVFSYWQREYGSADGYVEFCKAQQELCIGAFRNGLLQIVVPPNRLLIERNSWRAAHALKSDYLKELTTERVLFATGQARGVLSARQRLLGSGAPPWPTNCEADFCDLDEASMDEYEQHIEKLLQDAEAILGSARCTWEDSK